MLGSNYSTILQFCIAALLVNNIVLAEGVVYNEMLEEKFYLEKAFVVGISMIILTAISTMIYGLISNYILKPLEIDLEGILFAGIISILCTFIYCFILKKYDAKIFHKFIGLEKTLLTCNFIIYILVTNDVIGFTYAGLVLFTTLQAVGFAIILVMQGAINEERISIANIPAGIKGVPISLVTFGLMMMAFYPFMNGFS